MAGRAGMHAGLAPNLGREDLHRATVASAGLDLGAVGTIAIPGSLDEPAGCIAQAALDGNSHVRRRAM